jgi:hypothetical protein
MASQTIRVDKPAISLLTAQSLDVLDAIMDSLRGVSQGRQSNCIADEKGRLRVWAADIGALQPSESPKSLSYPLQDAPRMQESVKDGLERLLECADRGKCLQHVSFYLFPIKIRI